LGGLGNQLFIYAFSRALSLKYNIPVYLEPRTGFVKDPYKRKYRLNSYNINLKTCSWFHSLYYPLSKRSKILTRLLFGNAIYLNEQNFDVLTFEKLLNSSKSIYLDGYWQKEKFFSEFSSTIRKELTVKTEINAKNNQLALEMEKCNSVAVHFRRVQYNTLLGLEYYEKAMKQMESKMEHPVFYIFSDDMAWCKKNLHNTHPLIFIDHNTEDEISELWLMSQCKHFIVANSSFSWWGAFLSNNMDRIVIAPDANKTN